MMVRNRKWLMVILIGLSLVSQSVVAEAADNQVTVKWVDKSPANYAEDFEKIMEDVLTQYAGGEVNKQALFEAAMQGMFRSLDAYSSFFNSDQTAQFLNNTDNVFVGIGVQLLVKNGRFEIIKVFDGGDAKTQGVEVGDQIIKVKGQSTEGLTIEELIQQLKGQADSRVELTILRGQTERTFQLLRKKIVLPTVIRHELDDRVDIDSKKLGQDLKDQTLYLEISNFGQTTAKDFEKQLKDGQQEGKKLLLLDLRNNPGGYLTSVLEIANMLIPKAKVVTFVDKQGKEMPYYSNLAKAPYQVVLLVNENSASASELLAAALKDNQIAVVVGETTYGKGVAQKMDLSHKEYSYKMTVQEFFSPKGNKINGVGVKPDVVVTIPSYVLPVRRLYTGDKGKDVYQTEAILHYLGYLPVQPDQLYDVQTVKAVKQFQKVSGLYVGGLLDLTTQSKLNEALRQSVRQHDPQLAAALSQLKKTMN